MAMGLAVGVRWNISSAPVCSISSLQSPGSTFLAPTSSKRLRRCLVPDRHVPHSRAAHFRKCLAQISTSSAVTNGVSTEFYDSMVQFHLGVLQSVADVGIPLGAHDLALNWWGIAVPVVLWYIVAAPGSVSGLLDFAYTPLHASSNISFDPKLVEVGRQIGQGSFGIVYEGYIRRGTKRGSEKDLHVILKKEKPRSKNAAEMHYAEVHMNRRVKRTAPGACAEFLGTANVLPSDSRGRLSEGLWMVWRYEGDQTLAYYMKQKNFPDNIAGMVLGRKGTGTVKRSVGEQNYEVICKIATQILTALSDLHKTGLVHRDVKPQNLILAQDSGKFKLVDLGAAVDIRSGYNFVPDETIIDPVYAAPEHHVMPTTTPQLPPDPLCSLVSPIVWLLNTPDRFDLFSAGLIILQMAVRPLRQDIGLQAFNMEFKRADYDLDAWRRRCRFSEEEFSLLDADGAAGWELVRSMLQPRHDRDFFIWPSLGSSRPSAEAALRHRFLTGRSKQLPAFNFPDLPSFLSSFQLPAFNFPDLPSFLSSFQPGSLVPKFAFALPKFQDIGAFMLVATISGGTLAASWLVFSALRDSAQKSYAVGQQAMESAGVTGCIFLVSILIFRSLLESQTTKSSGISDSNSDISVATASEPLTVSLTLQDRSTLPLHENPEDPIDRIPNLAGVEAERYSKDKRIRELILSSMPSHVRIERTKSGLAMAVQTMELQLASLESAIAASRLFSQQQQQQIIQMEQLLIKPRELVSGVKHSEN